MIFGNWKLLWSYVWVAALCRWFVRSSDCLALKTKFSVLCFSAAVFSPELSSVRLVNNRISRSITSGDVEILANGRYGLICDASLDMKDAAVVCRQLGFVSPLNISWSRGFDRLDNRPKFFLHNLTCNGRETNIQDCEFDVSYECMDIHFPRTHLECTGKI